MLNLSRFLSALPLERVALHKVKGVKELILSANALPLYLSPYSPDLNPIEML
ncbi:MAG: transposase [Selenomonadaceae bacterium]|nr:transposase [Selenomonadaceae bacterium]